MYADTFNPNEILVSYLGIVDYVAAWKIQKSLANSRQKQLISDCLIVQQHPHTYTIGKRGTVDDILLNPNDMFDSGIRAYRVDRGGGATYHGPGQILAYPIMDTRPYGGPARYVAKLEETIILTLGEFGLKCRRIQGSPGVWVGTKKIASIGLKIDNGITTHGFSININNDLSYFDQIVTCGVANLEVTSVKRLTKQSLDIKKVVSALIRNFCQVFHKELKDTPGRYFLQAKTDEPSTPLKSIA